jgi:hypothetical protein
MVLFHFVADETIAVEVLSSKSKVSVSVAGTSVSIGLVTDFSIVHSSR